MMRSKILIILLAVGFLAPSFGFLQAQSTAPPETLKEAKEMGERAGQEVKIKLPGILEKIWKEEALPIWQKIYQWFKTNIWLKIESWFRKAIEPWAKEEIEKRKPLIEEEFKKEKEELKEEAPILGKSLWERFKELIK